MPPGSQRKITEKSPCFWQGAGKVLNMEWTFKAFVLLNNSPPQGKLFCKSQIHLGFYQSLTNLRERKYSSPAPIAFLSYLRGKILRSTCEGPILKGTDLLKDQGLDTGHQQDGRRKLWHSFPPGTHQFNNCRQLPSWKIQKLDERLMHTRQAWNQIHWNIRQI